MANVVGLKTRFDGPSILDSNIQARFLAYLTGSHATFGTPPVDTTLIASEIAVRNLIRDVCTIDQESFEAGLRLPMTGILRL